MTKSPLNQDGVSCLQQSVSRCAEAAQVDPLLRRNQSERENRVCVFFFSSPHSESLSSAVSQQRATKNHHLLTAVWQEGGANGGTSFRKYPHLLFDPNSAVSWDIFVQEVMMSRSVDKRNHIKIALLSRFFKKAKDNLESNFNKLRDEQKCTIGKLNNGTSDYHDVLSYDGNVQQDYVLFSRAGFKAVSTHALKCIQKRFNKRF